jgi:hypothetical protein
MSNSTVSKAPTFADVQELANTLNKKYPAVKAEARVSENGGRFEIEVVSVEKAKALFQMFGFSKGIAFTCGPYK